MAPPTPAVSHVFLVIVRQVQTAFCMYTWTGNLVFYLQVSSMDTVQLIRAT